MSTRISRHAALQPLLALLAALAPAAAAHAPHDVVTEAAISPTFAQDHTLLAAFTFTDHLLVGRSVDGGASWQKYGLPMLAHDVTGFAFSPQFAQDGIAFAATGGGGVWRTKNAGLDWKPALGGLPSLTVLGVAVSPDFATDGVVLAATEGGCARSTDGGRSWTTITAGLAETTLHVVVFAPDSADDVIIAGKVVQTSSDRGLTWTSHAAFPDPVETLAVSRHYGADGTAMLAFGRFGNGTRLTTNGCLSFAASDAGLSDAFVIELAVADDGTTFAATKTAGCFRAAAPGAPWELAINGFEELSDQTSNHNTEALVSPDFGRDRTAFIGAFEGLYITTDGGDSWRECNIYSQMLNRHVFFSPDYAHDRTIFCGNYGGGVYEYTDLPAPGAPGGPGSPAGSLAPPSGGAPVLGPPAGGLPGTDRGSAQIDAHDPLPQVPRWHGRSNNIAALFSDALALSPAFASDRTMFYGYTVL
ncbi:MAG TPA: hypothetical protein VK824_02160, partial [Planctomycetota bacterium]|nr:hypothetical protein [Planctomycetota bacterium]